MDKANAEYKEKVFMVLINIENKNQEAAAAGFAEKNSLSSGITHVYAQAPAEFGLQYIPHLVTVDKNGNVTKNYKDITLPADVEALAK